MADVEPTDSDQPAISRSGASETIAATINAIIDRARDYAQARTEQAGRLTSGPFHAPGGIDVAAGGAMGVMGKLGVPGDAPGPLAQLLQRVFHGTGEAFTQFDPGKTRHPGYWFSTAPAEANLYATGAAPNVRSASLALTNPATAAQYSQARHTVEQAAARLGERLSPADLHVAVGQFLARQGFDGVMVPGVRGGVQFAVFDPAKIGPPK